MKDFLFGAAIILSFAPGASAETIEVANASQLTAALEKTKPGATVQLAAGEFSGALTIPAGVSLRGAGYGKTTVNVGAADVGVTLSGGQTALADLTIISHGGTAILAGGGESVRISGILVRGGAVGLRAQQVETLRIENCIFDGSSTGIALDAVKHATVVNNTLTHADTIGLALTAVEQCEVFNNAIVHAGVAISIRKPGPKLLVDHNLYLALYTGKYDDEAARISLGPWRDVSDGLDAESVCLPIVFRDAAHGDYQPVSTLAWNPGIATSANWGVKQLGAAEAPASDITGQPRPAVPGVGAREAAAPPAVATDGTFTVERSEGTKSAGVFTRDGTLVRYLFRDLPLPKGMYGFVLPSRSEQGAKIAAGDYELRLVESNLRWDYRMLTANNGVGTQREESDLDGVWRAILGPNNSLILGAGWNERGENVRAKRISDGTAIWSLPGGKQTLGLCRGGDGLVYVLQQSDPHPVIIRIDREGHLKAWPGGALKLPVAVAKANGLAELGGDLFITSADGDVYRVSTANGELRPAFKAAAPFHPFADRQRKLLWMICGSKDFSGGAVTAFTPSGEVKYTLKPCANPLGVAINGDRLAVADYDAGKIRFFDIAKPEAPVAAQTIGRGDGPYGPVVPDRFWFQKGAFKSPHEVVMDLDDTGRLSVLDGGTRPLVFDADGKNPYMGNAQFGNAPFSARFPDEDIARFFDPAARVSWVVDARNNSWRPEAYWGRPELSQGGNANVGFFKHQGHVYGVMRYTTPDAQKRSGFLILRYENYVGKIVAFYCPGKNGISVVRDVNSDGAITAADGEGTTVLDTAGNPVNAGEALARFSTVHPNGDIRGQTFKLWSFKGVNASGYPIYEFPPAPVAPIGRTPLVSPYDFKTSVSSQGQSESVVGPDGELLVTGAVPDTVSAGAGGSSIAMGSP